MVRTLANLSGRSPPLRPDLTPILLRDRHHRRPWWHSFLEVGPAGGGFFETGALHFRRMLDADEQGFAVGGKFRSAHFGPDRAGEEELHQCPSRSGQIAG